MIDIHSHILPGLDDGPATLRESLDMARVAVDAGISAMIATPHVVPGIYDNSRQEILAGCAAFNAALKQAAIPLIVYPGAEVRMTPELPGLYDAGRLMILNDTGGALLLELPDLYILDGLLYLIREFKKRGVRIIIAHPERNRTIRKHPPHLKEILYTGAQCQITAGSLTGGFGKRVQTFAFQMIETGAARFIASDAHSNTHRPPDLREAHRLVDESVFQETTWKNPVKIICSEYSTQIAGRKVPGARV